MTEDTDIVVDLDTLLDELVHRVSKHAVYRSPTADELIEGRNGLARLAIGDLAGAGDLLTPLGFTVSSQVDAATGRAVHQAVSESSGERAWGVYVVDATTPVRLSIVVPHPRSDHACEQLALSLWRSIPGALLSVSAVHRDAPDTATTPSRTADHAHNPATLFHHHWSDVLGPRLVPQIQLHGFDDDTAPERVAVSTGAGVVTPAAERIADEITAVISQTTRSWDDTASPALVARTNVQGIAARDGGWVWVHLELNRTARDTPSLWQPAMAAVAAADPTLLGQHRPPGP